MLEQREAEAGWQDPEGIGEEVPPIGDPAIAATIALVEYVWDRYGRFPATYPAFHTLMGFQAGHIDESYYYQYYRPGSLSETHREHDQRWHQSEEGEGEHS